jgi:hypothetical protein
MIKTKFYVVYDCNTQQYAGRKQFHPEFSMARIYKEEDHARNAAKLKFSHLSDNVAIIPIDVVLDPLDEFSAVLGAHRYQRGEAD